MTPRAAKKRSPCDAGTASRHLDQARQFVADAQTSIGNSSRVVLLVMAGINAADAICCVVFREHATGSDHLAAQDLLATVRPNGKALASSLEPRGADAQQKQGVLHRRRYQRC